MGVSDSLKNVMGERSVRTVWSTTCWLWRAWRGHRWQAFLNTAIGISTVVVNLAFVWCTKLAIDIATHTESRFTLAESLGFLTALLAMDIALSISSRWVKATLGVKAQNTVRSKVFAHLLRTTWKGLKAYHSGDMMSRMERDVTTVVGYLTESLSALITTIVQFVGAFLLLFYMDRTLALVVVVLIPVFLFISRLYVKRMKALTHQVRDTESRIQALVQESIQHSLVIKTLERVGFVMDGLHVRQNRLCGEVRRRTRYALVSSTVMNVGFTVGYLFSFSWGVSNLSQGLITYGSLIAFVQLVGQIQGPARDLTRFIPLFINTYTSAERLMEMEDIPLEELEERPATLLSAPIGIRLRDVSFSYEPASRAILSHLDVDLPPGSRTAILGETGVGKTTLVRLLLGLVDPQEGDISLYDGTKSVPASPGTRHYFAYVPQGNTLISGTVRSNLLLGDPHASEEEMKAALYMAAADFVLELPDGLDTPCGEQGNGLSEGQAQRVCIARTLLRKAPVLLFDEATSALDTSTEEKVVRRVVEHFAGHTILFITHRPRVLDYCTHQLRLAKDEADGSAAG